MSWDGCLVLGNYGFFLPLIRYYNYFFSNLVPCFMVSSVIEIKTLLYFKSDLIAIKKSKIIEVGMLIKEFMTCIELSHILSANEVS